MEILGCAQGSYRMSGQFEPKSTVKKIDAVSVSETHEMHQLFLKYYNNADLETFVKDIIKKQYVLLIKHPKNGKIVGFSTIALLNISYKNKSALGLFSGDTILEKEFWGSRRWQLTWVLFCLKVRLFNLRVPFFWLLISKGYKTYLLLANNFVNYYPRLDKDDTELGNIVDIYCEHLYPEHYIKERQLLDFGEEYQNLKSHVAEISDELRESQPKIRFFEERNPEWWRGTELPCVGVIDIPLIIKFVKKVFIEKFKKCRSTSAVDKALTQ
jgi:hypothetical protein